MITKEEFLKAVETINAYMKQVKIESEINLNKENSIYHVRDFLRWFDNLGLSLDVNERSIRRRIITCLSQLMEERYYDYHKKDGFHDIRNYNSKSIRRLRNLGNKSSEYLLNSIKEYENLHPKTIY